MITTIYDADVNGGVPVDMNIYSFPYTVKVKLGVNDVNEKSSSLAEEKLFAKNTWRGLSSGNMTLSGIIDRRLYDKDNLMTKALLDAFIKSPNSKLIVSEFNGAKFYDIVSINYNVTKISREQVRSDISTTVFATASKLSSTLAINATMGFVAGMMVKVYYSSISDNFEYLEIESIANSTLTLKTKTIMVHNAGASVSYDATQDSAVVPYTIVIRRVRNPSTY